jgi:hypothetical protein
MEHLTIQISNGIFVRYANQLVHGLGFLNQMCNVARKIGRSANGGGQTVGA